MFRLAATGALELALIIAGVGTANADDTTMKLRVGTYDNRAIAAAYAPSKYNLAAAKMKEYNEAIAAGDTGKVEKMKAWGKKRQRQFHRQGFGRVPVDDLLAHVKDQLPEVAKKANVDVIVFQCTFAGDHVEVVDVTKELVALFEPSEKTLKIVEELMQHRPVDLDEIEQHHDH